MRIVITLGDVLHEEGDLFGGAIALAARIEAVTPPDDIYMSAAARLAVNPRGGSHCVDRCICLERVHGASSRLSRRAPIALRPSGLSTSYGPTCAVSESSLLQGGSQRPKGFSIDFWNWSVRFVRNSAASTGLAMAIRIVSPSRTRIGRWQQPSGWRGIGIFSIGANK